ncbi:MAG: hypothetical protein ACKO8Z_18055 [Prosthecobacter sp.]
MQTFVCVRLVVPLAALLSGDANAKSIPVKLRPLTLENGHLGQKWQTKTCGHLKFFIMPFADLSRDTFTASWPLNADCAKDWQRLKAQARSRMRRPS